MLCQKFRIRSAVTLLAVAVGGGNLLAQPATRPAAQQNVQQSKDQQPAQTYRVKQVLGSKVNIEGNTSIGTVDDVVFDDNGYIEYLIVLNEGKLVTIPWEAAKFNFETRTAMVRIAPEKFQQIPTYAVDQYPTFSAPTYRTQTYQYYGLTPGQSRRLDRRLP